MAGVVDIFAGAGKVDEFQRGMELGFQRIGTVWAIWHCALSQYSTALTSWLVVFSISLIAKRIRASEKLRIKALKMDCGLLG